MSRNPFVSIGAIRDPKHFYGREMELRKIFNYLVVNPPQSFQIIGDDKTGKTSLLNYLSDPEIRKENGLESEKFIFLYFSFQSNPLITQAEFWRKILKKISRQITNPEMKSYIDQIINTDELKIEESYDLFRKLREEGYQIFLMIDEFQIIAQNENLMDKEFFTRMRYISTSYNLNYMLATTENVINLIPETYGSPFPNTFATIKLNIFTEKETNDFIIQVKQPITPSLEEEQEFIQRLAGGHPYLTQIVCYWVFDVKSQKGNLTEDDKKYIIEQSYDEVFQFFQVSIWSKFSSTRIGNTLLDITWGRAVDVFANRDVIRKLNRDYKYIIQKDNEWSIFCELFKRFLREQNTSSSNENKVSFTSWHGPRLEYDDFEINITSLNEDDNYRIEVSRTTGYEESETSKINLMQLEDDLKGIRERDTDLKFLREFGDKLLNYLILGKVKRVYDNAFGSIKEGERGMRIRLRVDVPELASLPWEFLLDKENGRWLGLSRSITLSRYVKAPTKQPRLKINLPLNMLLTLSNPANNHELGELNLKKECDLVFRVMRDMIDLNMVSIDVLNNPTITDLREKLNSKHKRYNVLHFCGHGLFTDEDIDVFNYPTPLDRDQGYLIFQDDEGHTRPVHQETLVELTKGMGLSLVILNACHTATSSPTHRLSGMATALARSGIPAVVAMQYEVLDDVSSLFAKVFYARLVDGLPVDVCVNEARRAIAIDYDHSNRDWATPVLFMRAKDGMIFDIKSN